MNILRNAGILASACCCLLACRSTPSDLKKVGPNLYVVKGGNVGGYRDQGNLIARGEADKFCRKKGKVMAGIFDQPPTADFNFKCIPLSEDPASR